jgi:hypothetical protein
MVSMHSKVRGIASIQDIRYSMDQTYRGETDPRSRFLEMIFSSAAALLASDIRNNVVERQHLNWQAHVRRLRREGAFSRFYRMSYTSFQKLLSMLQPSLFVYSSQS